MVDTLPIEVEAKKRSALPFASTVEGLKTRLSQITEDKKMGADLLFMNTYMASLALADASRPEIFSYAANRKEYVSSPYVAKVDMFVKKWSYSYSEALGIVAERTHNKNLQSMLNRYANAIESGVPDDDFLKNELSTVRTDLPEPDRTGTRDAQEMGRCVYCNAFVGDGYCRYHHDLDRHLFAKWTREHPQYVLCNHPHHLRFWQCADVPVSPG